MLKINENCLRPKGLHDRAVLRKVLEMVMGSRLVAGAPLTAEVTRHEFARAAAFVFPDAFIYVGGCHVSIHPPDPVYPSPDRILVVGTTRDWR